MFGGGAVAKQGAGAQALTLSWTAARKPSAAQTAAKGGMITSGQHATFTIQTSHVKLNLFRSNITRHSDRSPPLRCDLSHRHLYKCPSQNGSWDPSIWAVTQSDHSPRFFSEHLKLHILHLKSPGSVHITLW